MAQLILSVLKLGLTAFGGPAVAYAMMHQEFVKRRKWLNEDRFFEYLGVANLIPGPNATELVMFISYQHTGWLGVLIGGICYILPAMAIVLVLSWLYVQFGSLPEFVGILCGIKPVIVAILLSAIYGLLKPRFKRIEGLAVALGVLIAYLLGVGPFILMIAGGFFFLIIHILKTHGDNALKIFSSLPLAKFIIERLAQEPSYHPLRLFWVFLKAGALMYGSGYVLLAFIHEDLVVRLGWLTNSQMVDAIALGQVTPGPLATTATFVGYLMGGLPAALIATFAMFLPSFCVTTIILLVLKFVKTEGWVSVVLEGVSFAALGLMVGVTWEVMTTAIVDPVTAVIGLIALILLMLLNISAPWLVLGGALIGWVRMLLLG